mgnify:CR=1 FL=1
MLKLWNKISTWKHFDKVKHFGACYVITLWTWEGAFWAGITKEYCDSKNPDNKWSWGDIGADAAGIVAGELTKFLIRVLYF